MCYTLFHKYVQLNCAQREFDEQLKVFHLDKTEGAHELLPFVKETVISDMDGFSLLLPVHAPETPPQSRKCTVPH